MRYENGKLIGYDGYPQNMHDYLATKPVVPRIYDYNTKNKSFLNIYLLLKELGVKNCNEHLQLFNPALLGIDPHDPNLKSDIKAAIENEIKCNLWYYLREVVRVPSGDTKKYFDLNIGSFSVTFLITRRQNFFYEISRQVGKTFLLTTISGWIINFGGTRINMANMHHTADSAVANLNLIKDSLSNIPEWLQYHKYELDKVDKKTGRQKIKPILAKSDNAKSLENKLFRNKIQNVIVGGSLDSANKAGRGSSRHIYLIDEIPHIKFNNIAFGSLNNSTSTKMKEAKNLGIIHGIWLLGTPGKLKTPHGKWMYDLIRNQYIPFNSESLFLFDLTTDKLEEYANARSISNFWHVKFSWDELGFDEKWFFDKNRNEEVASIRSETMLIWEEEVLNSPFTRNELAALETKSRNFHVKRFKLDDTNTFLLYPTDDELHHNTLKDLITFGYNNGILIGVDVANGTGNDYSTLTFVDAVTLRIFAQYKNNMIDTDDFALLISFILENYIQPHNIKCAIQIERNNSGTSVIARLKKYPHLQKYLIAYPVGDIKMKDLSKPVDIDNNYGQRADFGFNTTTDSRKLLTDTLLKTLVKKHTPAIASPDIVSEVKNLIVTTNLGKTRIEHAAGCHDDLIFSMLHCYYMPLYGADILLKRHGIRIDATRWLINEGVEILTGQRKAKRIVKQWISTREKGMELKYLDTFTNKYVSEKRAKELQSLSEDNAIGTITTEKQKELVIENAKKSIVTVPIAELISHKPSNPEVVYFEQEKEFKAQEEIKRDNSMLRNLYSSFRTVR